MTPSQLIQLEDLPIVRDLSLAWVDGRGLHDLITGTIRAMDLGPSSDVAAVIERVGSMPGQGVSSSFNFGVGFGSCLPVLQLCKLPIHLVTPAKWKRDLGLSRDKNASLDKARLLFPGANLSLKKHDGRAEALLLGHWYLTRGTGASA
jgi:hypothetical protein